MKGAQGEDGPKGAQGEPGADGNFGGATFDYTFIGVNSAPNTSLANGQIYGFGTGKFFSTKFSFIFTSF